MVATGSVTTPANVLHDSGEPTATLPFASPGAPAVSRRRRAPRKWPWVVAVCLLVGCVLAGTAVYLVRDKVFVPTQRVPQVRGEALEKARSKLLDEHFSVRVEPAVKSTSVPLGRVVREEPSPGVVLKQGSAVRLVPSAGLPTVTVPSLFGHVDCSVATELLLGAHLKSWCPARSVFTSEVPSGDVVSWSVDGEPNPARVLYGATVAVAVSKGKPPVRVPALGGALWTRADSMLTAEGLQPHKVLAYSATLKAGEVVTTLPPPGATLPNGSTIAVVVSKGAQLVAVPSIVADTLIKAIKALEEVGLRGGPLHGPPTGIIYATKPQRGQRVKIGTRVTLYTRRRR